MEQKTASTRSRAVLISGLVLGALALTVFGVIAANQTTKSSNIKINVGENSIEMGFEKDGLNLRQILDELFADEERRRETLALLREFNDIYKVSDKRLIDRLSREPGESSLSGNFRRLLFDLQGPFRRNFHKYYDVEQVSVVEAIAKLDYDHEVARRIRELRNESKGPFEERIKPVRIGVSNDGAIASGYAAVCRDGDFYREQLYLFEPSYQKLISVNAFEPRHCPKTDTAGHNAEPPVVRISRVDAERLFGDRILGEYEAGFAQITWKPPVVEPPRAMASTQG